VVKSVDEIIFCFGELGANILELRILPGTVEHLSDCIEALRNSELGEVYYHPEDELRVGFTEGFSKGEIFVALDEGNNCLGYIWIALSGAFYGFPYCRNIAIKKNWRGRGIGSALLRYYEKVGFENSNRLFILVSDFNHDAPKLYERLGYEHVGVIPNLFKMGVSENILVKFGSEDDIAETTG